MSRTMLASSSSTGNRHPLLRLVAAVVISLIALTFAGALFLLQTDGIPARHAHLPEYIRPFRPSAIRIINGLGTALLGPLGVLAAKFPLDPDVLIDAACAELEKEGFALVNDDDDNTSVCPLLVDSEIGGNQWQHGLERLTKSIRNNANLTMLGRVVFDGQIMGVLTTRGKLLHQFASTKTTEVIREPIFIVGLPRTGTTFLQRLLSLDPNHRAPQLWEYMNPVPRPPTPQDNGSYDEATLARIEEQEEKLTQFKSLAPGLDSFHPMTATEPEECVIIMNYMLDSQQFDVTFPIMRGTYMQWLLGQEENNQVPAADHVATLKWHKRVLQHLQDDGDADQPRPQWVLKTPYYLAMMDDIRAVYPDAKIIQTHRDPIESVLSLSSVVAKIHGMVTDDLDLERIGKHQMRITSNILEKAMKVRNEWRKQEMQASDNNHDSSASRFRVVDVHLEDLQSDTMGTIRKLYRDLLGVNLSTVAENQMVEWLEQNPRNRHGTHRPPSPQMIGIEGGQDNQVFEAYRAMFRVSCFDNDVAFSTDDASQGDPMEEATNEL